MSDAEDRVVETIYEALDRSDPAAALEVTRLALEREPDDPVLHFLAGISLLELDRTAAAAAALGRAVELDPDDPEFRANHALALFADRRFEDALREAEEALSRDDTLPDTHYALGLALERAERFADADRAFARAAELDPDAFPLPLRLGRADFERRLANAADRLPDAFRSRLGEVVVTVEDLPADALLDEEPAPLDPELFGLFVGVPLTERSNFSPGGDLPPRILIFQRNLERAFPEPDLLTDEIARTLYHELGHYLGMDEDDLDELGMA